MIIKEKTWEKSIIVKQKFSKNDFITFYLVKFTFESLGKST